MDRWTIFAAVMSILWTFFKTAGFLEVQRLSKLERLFQALEIGVSDAWNLIVKPWLAAHPNEQKLPDEVRIRAERHAISAAAESDTIVSKFDAVTVLATLKAAVEEAKRRGGK
jgi:hypothetical protein